MDFLVYIVENSLVVIPILLVIGVMFKDSKRIKDKYIPILLLVLGVLLTIGLRQDISIDTVVQGVLVTATSVYLNQVVKQLRKRE